MKSQQFFLKNKQLLWSSKMALKLFKDIFSSFVLIKRKKKFLCTASSSSSLTLVPEEGISMWTGLSSPNILQNNSQACSDSSVSCEDGTDICFWKHRLPSVHKTFSTEGGKDWHYPPGRSLNCSVVQLKNPVHTEWTGAPSQEGPLQHLSLANPNPIIIIFIFIFTSSPSLSAAAAAATYTKMRHICCLLEQIKAQTFRSKEESIVLRLLCLILFHQTPTERNQLQ